MKQALSVCTGLMMAAGILLCPMSALAQSGPFAGGDGTSASPYRIETAQQLQQMAEYPTGYFQLAADIDLAGVEWQPVGDSLTPFEGVLDGDGHTVSNLTLALDGQDMVGLFGRIGVGGQVEELTLENVTVSGQDNVGALAGMNGGSIEYCQLVGDNTVAGRKAVGGLVGDNWTGRIEGCVADADVTANTKGGVLAGDSSNSKAIQSSAAFGSVTGGQLVGGITGSSAYSSVTSCYAVVQVNGQGGGAVGEVQPQTIEDVYYAQDVAGQTDTGKGEPMESADMKTDEFVQDLNRSGSWQAQDGDYPVPVKDDQPDTVDKSELQKVIRYAESIDLSLYTDATADAVRTALDKARQVNDDAEATQQQVNEAQQALMKAIAGLEEKPQPTPTAQPTPAPTAQPTAAPTEQPTTPPSSGDSGNGGQDGGNGGNGGQTVQPTRKPSSTPSPTAQPANTDELKKLVEYAESLDLNKYYDEGKDAFEEALANAREVLAKQAPTAAEVTEATRQLRNAADGLKLNLGRDELEQTVNKAKQLDLENADASAVTALQTALDNAEKALANPDATAEQLQAAHEALLDAIDAVQQKDDASSAASQPESQSQPEQSSGSAVWLWVGAVVLIAAAAAAIVVIVRRNRK
ncbi:hypothetical protein B5F36_02340 [Anaerofilum sp. An201]|nr:GLUG motif-containing protein [Anaerofilum sp. An201]OUP05116.1 hypothetical protein B5F36_02340 [Anaerofilum sp. An201]